MKYIKTYERLWNRINPEREIEVGDVVKVNCDTNYYGIEYGNFAANHIAKVTYKSTKYGDPEFYVIFLPNEDDKPHAAYFNNYNYFKDPKVIEEHEILVSAKNEEELEMIINTKKYNL